MVIGGFVGNKVDGFSPGNTYTDPFEGVVLDKKADGYLIFNHGPGAALIASGSDQSIPWYAIDPGNTKIIPFQNQRIFVKGSCNIIIQQVILTGAQ